MGLVAEEAEGVIGSVVERHSTQYSFSFPFFLLFFPLFPFYSPFCGCEASEAEKRKKEKEEEKNRRPSLLRGDNSLSFISRRRALTTAAANLGG